MANSARYGMLAKSGSDRHLASLPGGAESEMAKFLAILSSDNVFFEDDFLGDAINLDNWTTNAGTGATAAAIPATPGLGGTITIATGTDGTANNRRVNLYGPPIYRGDNNAVLEVRMQVSAVTDIQWNLGWIDTHDTITTPIPPIVDIDTPTFASGANDVAMVGQDTGQTLTTMALCCLGSGALNTGSKDNLGTLAPTAATYMLIRIGLIGNTVVATVDRKGGNSTYQVARASGMEGGTLVRPYFFCHGVTATSRTYTFDYVRILMDR